MSAFRLLFYIFSPLFPPSFLFPHFFFFSFLSYFCVSSTCTLFLFALWHCFALFCFALLSPVTSQIFYIVCDLFGHIHSFGAVFVALYTYVYIFAVLEGSRLHFTRPQPYLPYPPLQSTTPAPRPPRIEWMATTASGHFAAPNKRSSSSPMLSPSHTLSPVPSYGTYDTSDCVKTTEELRREAAREAIRSRTTVSFNESIPGAEEVGGNVQDKLERIFANIHGAEPMYKELGGTEKIAEALHSSLEEGVKEETVPLRRRVFGVNHIPEEPPLTFWDIYKAAWQDNTIIMLTVSAMVSLVLGLTVPEPGATEVNYETGWIEGFAIICSVLIVTGVSSINDYRKEQKFHKLTEECAAQPITVKRGGTTQTIDVTEIVVGDLVNLSPGLVVPVDGFYVCGKSVVVDESSVTGENDPKKKNAEEPWVLTGTVVCTAEDAYILAGAVGERSFGGKLLMEARGSGTVNRMTPLQTRLDDVAELIGRIGLSAALLLFTILSVLEVLRMMQGLPGADPRHFLDYFLLCVAILVVAVPEGLPLAVTIALAYSQGKMHKDNNQVRRLRACETMGNATQICSDKTGTLTQNVMSVVQGYIGMSYFQVKRPGDLPERLDLHGIQDATRKRVLECIAVNSSSEKVFKTAGRDGTPEASPFWSWLPEKGNKTDNALLDFVDRALYPAGLTSQAKLKTLPHQDLRRKLRAVEDYTIFPFTSDRKRMSVVVRGVGEEDDGTFIHYVKGGSDRVLPLCDRYMDEQGHIRPLEDKILQGISQQVRQLAKQANRTIGIAYTPLPDLKSAPAEEPTEKLIWIGLIGIQDPLRPEVIEAVKKCQMAGVTVRMCTGDNLDTAVAISRQCGIYNPFSGDIALTGEDFRRLVYDAYGDDARMEKFAAILKRMTVMGRSQPLDKQLLVLMLMLRGEVVAVTGDGTNDAPALRLANVGFVMRSGTDVAVKSADIVLLDDNFRSVQRAVVWGRCVNDNIRKFLQLQLTVNYVSVALTFIGSVAARGASSPLTTVQLLWVNLIMDTLAALALATEEPTEECLQRGPVSRSAPLISHRMHATILINALYILGITLTVQMWGSGWFQTTSAAQLQTVVFNVFVLCILTQMINCRKLYDELNMFEGMWSRSKLCIVIILCCLAFQFIAVETFGPFMDVEPLRMDQWFGCFFFSLVVWLCGIISRLVPIEEPVYGQSFDFRSLGEETQEALIKLGRDVAKAQETEDHSGKYLERASRLRVKMLWSQAIQHHITAAKVVNAFRRARIDTPRYDSTPRTPMIG
eukprot:gene2226-1389_t